jgi:hypothetical protein
MRNINFDIMKKISFAIYFELSVLCGDALDVLPIIARKFFYNHQKDLDNKIRGVMVSVTDIIKQRNH